MPEYQVGNSALPRGQAHAGCGATEPRLSVRPPVTTIRTHFKPPKTVFLSSYPSCPPFTSFSASQRRPLAYIFPGELHPVCHKTANFAAFSKPVPEITKICNLPCSGYPKIPNRIPKRPRIKVGEIHSSRMRETGYHSLSDWGSSTENREQVQARLVIILKQPG